MLGTGCCEQGKDVTKQLFPRCLEKGPTSPQPVLRSVLSGEACGCHFVLGFQLLGAELSQQCQHKPLLGFLGIIFVDGFSSGSQFIHTDRFHPFDVV